MKIKRRQFAVTAMTAGVGAFISLNSPVLGETKMYGLIGRMICVEGKRDEFTKILMVGIKDMPGCLSYIVANDQTDKNSIWITEVWESKKHHEDSLKMPAVQLAIKNGRAMIAGMGERFETQPLGGHGIN